MSDWAVPPAPKAGAGVLDLLRQFRKEEATAVEPKLKAFEVLPSDTRRRPGALSGIPVAIKDIIATSDMPTTNGSPIYRDHVPAADAWIVERLRQLGATIFGKTVSTEFAWRHPGPTVNPWNPAHTPGWLILRLRRGGGRRHRAPGAGLADAGFGDPAGSVQRRRRP